MTVALPSSWKEAPIGTLCVNTEQVTPDAEAEFIYVDIASVDRETKKITSPQRMLGKDAPSRARKLIKTGDTIVSTTRPNLNAVALVDQALDGQIASTGFDVLRAPGLDPRWLGYLVRTSAFVDAMSSLVQGALYPAIRGKDVRSFVTPIAPANEQKRIADKLDTVLTRVDAVNTRLARVAPLLKRFRQSVLAAATSGRLTEDFASGGSTIEWPSVELCSVTSKVTDGEHQTPKRSPSGRYLLSARNIRDGSIALSNVDFVDDIEFAKLRLRCDPSIGDVLLSCSGSVGRVALVDKANAYVMVRSAAMIRPKPELLNSKYLMYTLQSPNLQEQIANASKSTAQANIFLGPIKKLMLPLPQLEEQTEIVRRVETLFAFADRLEARLAQAQTAATRLTPALLAKAFRGELVPQDPNDEPAAELLRRLQTERATAPKASAGRGRKVAVQV